jgi:hypothetical protein
MASTASVASMPFTASVHQKITATDSWILPGNQKTNAGPYLWNGLSKIQFSLISVHFLLEAVEVSRYYLYKNWLMKLKYPYIRIYELSLNKF